MTPRSWKHPRWKAIPPKHPVLRETPEWLKALAHHAATCPHCATTAASRKAA